jgi:putative heme iron utilization protein
VTDCARISLEFATAEGLERAATFVLQAASTFKNRVANPTDEGYRDLMFTVRIGGHVCEVRTAPPSPAAFLLCPSAAQSADVERLKTSARELHDAANWKARQTAEQRTISRVSRYSSHWASP